MPAAEEKKKTRTVFERKLAVMKRCSEIAPDKKHPKFGFYYNSIQQVSNKLREYAVAEGLDISVDFPPEHPGYTRVTLTCSDSSDEMEKFYPIAPDDKGLAYSTKYPLIRLFLIGDGEENDEAEMAARSSALPPSPSTPGDIERVPETDDRSAALTAAVRQLRDEGKVTQEMVAVLGELGVGSNNKRVSQLDVGAQVYLLRTLLNARREKVGGIDEIQEELEKLLDEY